MEKCSPLDCGRRIVHFPSANHHQGHHYQCQTKVMPWHFNFLWEIAGGQTIFLIAKILLLHSLWGGDVQRWDVINNMALLA